MNQSTKSTKSTRPTISTTSTPATKRIDKIILEFFPHLNLTRNKVQELINNGLVYYRGKCVERASTPIIDIINEKSQIEILDHHHFVGRGAKKIQRAIEYFELKDELQGSVIADIGAGTGGFTDYLLSIGVAKAYTIDVGHGQLDPKLLANPKVINFEGISIKDISVDMIDGLVDLAVADLSFISITKVLKNIFSLVKENGKVIVLFKPQFEVGKNNLNKKGIVKNINLVETSLREFKTWCKENNYNVMGDIISPIRGKEGNLEYLIYFKR
ncbi:MAG: TlyA family RNA methyltransferase [Oligoflexia bacterium]|nr:TlyA family RNA methyltransferase [Oligoflexia bacterium]